MQNITKDIYKLHKNEKGQTLLFVVVAMTIALSIGINASVRTLSSLSRTSRTDTASRALAAAEGGIERYLTLSRKELEDAIDVLESGSGSCPEGDYDSTAGACLIEFEGSSDKIVSQAYVTVEEYTPAYYPFSLESGQVKEINLYDYDAGSYYSEPDIEICWTSDPESDLLYTSYNDNNGIQARGGLQGVADSPTNPSSYETKGFDNTAVAGHDGYTSCNTVSIGTNIYGLRIRSVGGNSNVAVFPTGGAPLPIQGFRIESIGRIKQDQAVIASRAIKVVMTLPYLPASFDFALYSVGNIGK